MSQNGVTGMIAGQRAASGIPMVGTKNGANGPMTGVGNTTAAFSLLPTPRSYSLLVHRRNGYG